MATISDYNSLVAAILAYAHRQNLSTYVDYLIQAAQEQVERDIPDLNFGNYIRFQEAPYPLVAMDTNGTTPVPTDWLGAKVLTLVDGTGGPFAFPLIFKAASWLYDNYPLRQAQGVPLFVARDVSTGGGTWPTTAGSLAITATSGQTVFSLAAGPAGVAAIVVALDGAILTPNVDYTISGTTLTLAVGALTGQRLMIQYASGGNAATPSASGTSVLVYGPYPDSAYSVQGTYYQAAPALSSTNTTNWMVLNAPMMLHAACMVQAGMFVPDDKLVNRWQPLYEARLKALVDADKAERWAASTMQVDVG